MEHLIQVKQDRHGFYSVKLNSRVIAYALTKEEASFFYRGIMLGIEEAGDKVFLGDSIFAIFH